MIAVAQVSAMMAQWDREHPSASGAQRRDAYDEVRAVVELAARCGYALTHYRT